MRPFADDVPNAGGASHIQWTTCSKRAAAAMNFVEHQRERIFDGRQAGGRSGVGPLLFFQRVRRMIGGDDLQPAVGEACQSCSLSSRVLSDGFICTSVPAGRSRRC